MIPYYYNSPYSMRYSNFLELKSPKLDNVYPWAIFFLAIFLPDAPSLAPATLDGLALIEARYTEADL